MCATSLAGTPSYALVAVARGVQDVGTAERHNHPKWDDVERHIFGSTIVGLVRILDYDERTGRAWKVLTEHYPKSELTLEWVARESGVTKNHLNQLVRSLSGTTVYKLLTYYRLYRSMRLVYESDCTLTEAAMACGYESSSSYWRAFKKTFKVAPSRALGTPTRRGAMRIESSPWTSVELTELLRSLPAPVNVRPPSNKG